MLPKLGKKRAQVAMELLVFLTDLRVNLKESAHFRESCFHFLIRGSKVACELLCFSENRSSEPQKKVANNKKSVRGRADYMDGSF